MNLFDIKNIAFEILNYRVSYIELIGTFFGLISVYLASRANILTWGTGIFNELFLFVLFYQIQLYADMFLQIYFFIVTLFGWYNWSRNSKKNSVNRINLKNKIVMLIAILVGTIVFGFIINHLHIYFPNYFKIQAAYPFIDSFIMVSSIIATLLLAKMKLETWYLWIVVDLVCIFLYFKKEIYFLSLEYLIFLLLACYGLYQWKKKIIYE